MVVALISTDGSQFTFEVRVRGMQVTKKVRSSDRRMCDSGAFFIFFDDELPYLQKQHGIVMGLTCISIGLVRHRGYGIGDLPL